MKQIAFFGLGAMGGPMATRLLQGGYTVRTAVHRSRETAERLAREGLIIADDLRAAVNDADAVITMLPADEEVKAVLTGLAGALRKGTILIDMSSCTTEAIQGVEAFYRPRGIPVLDAPVSGGVKGAADGTLTIFASGPGDAIDAADDIFKQMGTTVYRLGACGMGKAFKNLNNLLAVMNNMAVAEVFRVAERQGFDLELLHSVICRSSGASFMMKTKWDKMMNRDFNGGFALGLARKDVANALRLAGDVPVPMSKLLYELMAQRSADDDLDLSVLSQIR